MPVQQYPNGRWRAIVWHGGVRISANKVTGGPRSYETRLDAEQAVLVAKWHLKKNPNRRRPVEKPETKGEFRLPIKGEPDCRNCGEPAVNLHHIVPKSRSEAGRRDWRRNGVPLCRTCHVAWHNRLHEIPHRVLTDEEFLFACGEMGAAWLARHYWDDEGESPQERLERLEAAA